MLTQKELLALKAVTYGCNTNKKCGDGAMFIVFDNTNPKKPEVKEEISFFEALGIVFELIQRLDTEAQSGK